MFRKALVRSSSRALPALGRNAVLALVLAVTLVLAGGCDTAASLSPAACGVQCREDSTRVCLNVCAQRAHEGDKCSRDPCSGGPVCEDPLRCLLNSNGGFTCQRGLSEEWGACDPDQPLSPSNFCPGILFCRSVGKRTLGPDEPDRDQPCVSRDVVGSDVAGICAWPVSEGGDCDAGGRCRPCEPGLTCEGATADGLTLGKCLRACDPQNPEATCPCRSDGYACFRQRAGAVTGTYCGRCIGRDEACNSNSSGPCCDVQATCNGSECCRRTGVRCETDAQCCSDSLCTGGVCQHCGGERQQCCAGGRCDVTAACVNGMCQHACGATDEPCCTNPRTHEPLCLHALVCDGSRCRRCGSAPGQPCCAIGGSNPDPCEPTHLFCQDGFCQSCGHPREQCCPPLFGTPLGYCNDLSGTCTPSGYCP
jgi:hypothetical protein